MKPTPLELIQLARGKSPGRPNCNSYRCFRRKMGSQGEGGAPGVGHKTRARTQGLHSLAERSRGSDRGEPASPALFGGGAGDPVEALESRGGECRAPASFARDEIDRGGPERDRVRHHGLRGRRIGKTDHQDQRIRKLPTIVRGVDDATNRNPALSRLEDARVGRSGAIHGLEG